MSKTEAPPFLIHNGDDKDGVHTVNHPWNDKSHITMNELARRTGLSRAIVKHAVIPPGKESFVYHAHHTDEEWVYVLSGEGVAEVDGADYALKPGDFLGFSAPSVAHHLRNDSDADLILLMGGEAHEVEIADFPKLGKRKFTWSQNMEVVNMEMVDLKED
jgi:uncharacterized cupin superfamily protein